MGEVIRHELHARRGTVADVVDLAPRMRRVTVALADGAPPVPWHRLAVGDHVKLAFPDPRTGDLRLPERPGQRPAADAPRPVLRDATVRAVPDPGHVVCAVAAGTAIGARRREKPMAFPQPQRLCWRAGKFGSDRDPVDRMIRCRTRGGSCVRRHQPAICIVHEISCSTTCIESGHGAI